MENQESIVVKDIEVGCNSGDKLDGKIWAKSIRIRLSNGQESPEFCSLDEK